MYRRPVWLLVGLGLTWPCATLTHASERTAGSGAAERGRSTAVIAPELDDPLAELRRACLALEATLRHRVPEWSPEADAIKARLDAILGGMLDYEEIARRALGADWGKLTDAQRREFLQKFSALTNLAFVAAVNRPEVHLRFESETIIGPVASVSVTAWAPKPRSEDDQPIEYRLARKHDRWLVFDVLVDHVSLVDDYRDQFARLMRQGGIVEILERMQRKLDLAHRY